MAAAAMRRRRFIGRSTRTLPSAATVATTTLPLSMLRTWIMSLRAPDCRASTEAVIVSGPCS